MTKLPYMAFYVEKFEAHTTHLTPEEDGIYNRLLRLCWLTPGCSIPADPVWITRKMRMPGQYKHKIEPILDEFFTLKRGRYIQKKQRAIFRETKKLISDRKNAVSTGGKAKALKEKETSSSKATNLAKQTDIKGEESK